MFSDADRAELFALAGVLLFGADWKGLMARNLNVGYSIVKSWAKGRTRIPDGVWAEVVAMLDKVAGEVADLRGKIVTAAALVDYP